MAKPNRPLTRQQALTKRKNKFYTRLCRDRELRGLDFPVAWKILDRVGIDSPEPWESEESISKFLGCSVKSVSRAVTALRECGWFKIKRRGRGEGVSNYYEVVWDNGTNLSRSRVENRTVLSKEQDSSVQDNGTNLSHESSFEPCIESRSARAALPLGGSGAPLEASPGNASLVANSDCLQRRTETKAGPPRSMASRGQIFKTGVEVGEQRNAEARRKLADSLEWEVMMSAEDVGDRNHLQAVEACRRESERLGVGWTPLVPSVRPARIKPSLEALQGDGFTPGSALVQLKGTALTTRSLGHHPPDLSNSGSW